MLGSVSRIMLQPSGYTLLLYTVCILSMPFNIEEKSGVSPVSVARVLYRRVMHFNIVAKSGVSPVSVARVL